MIFFVLPQFPLGVAPRMIRTLLERGGMCAALGIRPVALGSMIFFTFYGPLASHWAPLALLFQLFSLF